MILASRGCDQFALRFPDGMRARIKAAAAKNGRSMNSEIIFGLDRLYPVQGAAEGASALSEPSSKSKEEDGDGV